MFKGEERIINIPGFTLTAKEWGAPDGIPVLALHGWLDNAATFSCLAPLLSHLHIVAVDSPGCGHSSHRAPGTITYVIDEVFHMLEVATALGWDAFHLMGHSRGGAVAQMMAAGCPKRIRSLVLLDVIGLFSATPQESLEHLRISVKSYFGQKYVPHTVYPDLASVATHRMVDSSLTYESALILAERGTEKVEGGFAWTFDRRELFFTSPVKYTHDMVQGFLSGIEAPTCIIMAEEGLFKNDKFVIANADCIRNKVLHFLPGGHFFHMNNPKIVAPLILEFYKSIS